MKRTDFSTNQTRKYLNHLTGDTRYNLTQSGLRLGFQIQCPGWDKSVPIQRYFKIVVLHNHDLNDSSNTYEVEEWGQDFYSDLFNEHRVQNLQEKYGPFLCIPQNSDLSVGLQYGGLYRVEMGLFISAWDYGEWQDFDEILQALQSTRVTFFMKSKYFDFTDLDNPVKFFIREEVSYLSLNHLKYVSMTLK